MADTEACSKREKKYKTSFLNVSQEEAESILGFELIKFYASQMPIEQFITTTAPEQLKKKIFERLIDCIVSEGFPEPALPLFNESVVTDNIGMILIAMVSYFKLTMGRDDLRLSREKKIIRKDEQFGGNMEFVRIQKINVGKNCYVLVVETKGDSVGKGLTQLLLALKSMCKINNDKKLVYGFLTTAIQWQLVIYDGQTWKLSELSTVLLANMRKQEDRWLKNNTQILDVIYSILSSI
ncbi:unnamed protein product [Rotaria sp. Silwood1]|nr:unnamed protein product [Rotaria sp. Silwood1]